MKENPILLKSKKFAIRIIRLYQYLRRYKNKYILSKQILRSGTSIGANVREAMNGQSRADFIAKLSIALKEAGETQYWLELLQETDYIAERDFKELNSDCKEIIALLISIIKTSKLK